ncbi:MAG: hypothetical protein OER96_08070 [Gammaproteobacteria bacterium]|nr:hypothetical protein [Gammaproteobacteria bacterium]
MNKPTHVKQVKVALTNLCNGQTKTLTLADNYHAVRRALLWFARFEDISVQRVDIRLSPVQCYA